MKPTEDLMHEHKSIVAMLNIMGKLSEKISNNQDPDFNDVGNILDFLRTFADKCHHGKEENALFPALIEAGMSKQSGPVAVMLYEHEQGRAYIKAIADALAALKTGDRSGLNSLAMALDSYIALLGNHIQKENNILFPMADKILSSGKQDELSREFERIENEIIGQGVHERYHAFLHQMQEKYGA